MILTNRANWDLVWRVRWRDYIEFAASGAVIGVIIWKIFGKK